MSNIAKPETNYVERETERRKKKELFLGFLNL
jgi:hypothetical protein